MAIVAHSMTIITGKTFIEQTIFLDNICFDNCKFVDCTFFYSGGPFKLGDKTELIRVTFKPIGAAQNTILLLQRLKLGAEDLTYDLNNANGAQAIKVKDEKEGEDEIDLATIEPIGGKH